MLELKIDLDSFDYTSVLTSLIPLVIKNKMLAGAASAAVSAKLRNMTHEQQEEFVAGFLTDNKTKITELLNNSIKNKGIAGKVSDFDVTAVK